MSGFVSDVRIVDVEGSTILIAIATAAGSIEILADCERIARRLVLRGTHIQGLYPGALGRPGLDAIAGKLKELADVDTLEIHGATRTTGANRGRPPRVVFA